MPDPDQPALKHARPVAAVIPCWNRADDVHACLTALARQSQRPDRVIVVDNASDEPIRPANAHAGFEIEVVRLESNAGGSGGFNAGIRRALTSEQDPLVWLLDSDAVPEPHALEQLIVALADTDAGICGSALVDPVRQAAYECGGAIGRWTGELVPIRPTGDHPRAVDYVAACSMLVDARVFRVSGMFPDTFIVNDDAMFCQRARAAGFRVVGVPRSRVQHPTPDGHRGPQRFFAARSSLGPAVLAGLGPIPRAVRVGREALRGAAQHLIGAALQAERHIAGLEGAWDEPAGPAAQADDGGRELDALAASIAGQALGGTVQIHATAIDAARRTQLARDLRELGCGGVEISSETSGPLRTSLRTVSRWIWGAVPDVAVVDARARSRGWLAGHNIVSVGGERWHMNTDSPITLAVRALGLLARSVPIAARAALAPPEPAPAARPGARRQGGEPALSVVIATHDRPKRLERTLNHLSHALQQIPSEVIVVNNGRDLREVPGGVRVLGAGGNVGVDAFNIGVREANADTVLILDDDAWPDRASLESAMAWMADEPDAGAVSFRRKHPGSGRFEWPGSDQTEIDDAWPDLGPCNLVRRSAWASVGGYEREFCLYRNDTDLALALLAAGWKIRFDPAWTSLHDSDSVTRQPPAWFKLATRNWVWMCRRHRRGLTTPLAIVLGAAWAHARSGRSARRQLSTVLGLLAGIARPPPPLRMAANGCAPSGRHLRKLVLLKTRLGRRRAHADRSDAARSATPAG